MRDTVRFTDLPERIDVMTTAETFRDRVLAWLSGLGEVTSPHGSPQTWMRVLLDLLKVERPRVVSPSMSGRFALPLLTEMPQKVSGVVAVALWSAYRATRIICTGSRPRCWRSGGRTTGQSPWGRPTRS